MRDPNRIPEVLKYVQHYWERHPDMRLGQVIYNLTWQNGSTRDYALSRIFNIEDDELMLNIIETMGNDNG